MICLMNDEPNTIGELLRRVHIQRSRDLGYVISQAQLAEWFGIDRLTFNKYYNDYRIPEGENLEKIVAKTGPAAYRLAKQIPPDLREQLDQVPPDALDELKSYIERFLVERGWRRIK